MCIRDSVRETQMSERPTDRSDDGAPEAATYDVVAVQDKWRKVWDDLDPFRAGSAAQGAEKRYALTMFPYPSGDLHMGHAEVMALHDVVARYWWQRGHDVLNPIGWDSFGLPAENAAIKRDENPAVFTYANIETDNGHDGFLLPNPHYEQLLGQWMRRVGPS